MKRQVLKALERFELGNVAAKILHAFPTSKDHFVGSPDIDWDESTAYLTDQSGIKNYPYGGIVLNQAVCPPGDVDTVKDGIIQALKSITDPTGNGGVFEWVCRREELYSGEYIERYPEILFDLRDGYGAGSLAQGEIWSKSLSHGLVPGCHKQHHATFLLSGRQGEIAQTRMTLMDVAPTVIDLLGIDIKNHRLDGRTILQHLPVREGKGKASSERTMNSGN